MVWYKLESDNKLASYGSREFKGNSSWGRIRKSTKPTYSNFSLKQKNAKKNCAGPMRSYTVKENHIGLARSFGTHRQNPVTFII